MDRDIGYFAAAPAPNLVAFAASLSSAPRPPGPPVLAGSLRPLSQPAHTASGRLGAQPGHKLAAAYPI